MIMGISFKIFRLGIVLFAIIAAQATAAQVPDSIWDKGPRLKWGSSPEKYYSARVVYPVPDIVNRIEGRVTVKVYISEQGKVQQVDVLQSASASLARAVVECIKGGRDWNPARLQKKNVSSWIEFDVDCRLSPSQKVFARDMSAFSQGTELPLYVIDGKLVNDYVELEMHQVKSVRVLKGIQAVALYGELGKNGVLVFQTKKGTPQPGW